MFELRGHVRTKTIIYFYEQGSCFFQPAIYEFSLRPLSRIWRNIWVPVTEKRITLEKNRLSLNQQKKKGFLKSLSQTGWEAEINPDRGVSRYRSHVGLVCSLYIIMNNNSSMDHFCYWVRTSRATSPPVIHSLVRLRTIYMMTFYLDGSIFFQLILKLHFILQPDRFSSHKRETCSGWEMIQLLLPETRC